MALKLSDQAVSGLDFTIRMFLRPCTPAFLLLLSTGLASLLTGCESGPGKPLPAAAQKALQQKFGTHLEQLRWQPDKDQLHASFVWKTIPVQVWLTAAGQVTETRLAMLDEDVPPALQDSLRRYYRAYQRQAMYLVETPRGFHYNMLLAAPGGPSTRFYFQADGHRVKHPLTAAKSTL